MTGWLKHSCVYHEAEECKVKVSAELGAGESTAHGFQSYFLAVSLPDLLSIASIRQAGEKSICISHASYKDASYEIFKIRVLPLSSLSYRGLFIIYISKLKELGLHHL